MVRLVLVITAAILVLTLDAHAATRTVRVIDGDTIQYGRTRVRLVGFDTPEIHRGPSGYKCDAERDLGLKAKARLVELTSAPHRVTLRWAKGKDDYGRSLARLYSDGKEVGRTLIAEGLAHPYDGRTRQGWC